MQRRNHLPRSAIKRNPAVPVHTRTHGNTHSHTLPLVAAISASSEQAFLHVLFVYTHPEATTRPRDQSSLQVFSRMGQKDPRLERLFLLGDNDGPNCVELRGNEVGRGH